MKRDIELQKPVAYNSIWLGKKEKRRKIKCMMPKKPKAYSSNWNIKISGIDLKMRCNDSKCSNVINCKEVKWKISKICNHSLMGGHICSFL